jgi:hypothetical protein
MRRFRAVSIVAVGVLVIGLASVALGMKEQPRPLPPPDQAIGNLPVSGPFVILQQGDTSWVQPHVDDTCCPGDTLGGHGGEGTGGPTGKETWCFENAPYIDLPGENGENVLASDSCGCNPPPEPWTYLCFDHVDVRTLPSQTGINFWHIDTYRADEVAYTGNHSLWCGSDSIWLDGNPVECGVWVPGKYPGYGNQWNCIAQLNLDPSYTVAMGCTVYFDPRYDTECKYDYFYCDVWDGSEWQQVALFNASSNNPGSECGQPTGGNPDYWGNTDSGQPNRAAWQGRGVPGEPAFKAAVDTLLGSVVSGPQIRWRFTSDGAWSDADGRGNTDGACFIDNIEIHTDTQIYTEDFEGGPGSLGPEWDFPNPPAIAQAWHLIHDGDAPYEGGDGGERTTCTLDSSLHWKARPDGGYPGGASWRNGWYYRLLSPAVPIEQSGCVVQYDNFMCCLEYTCDYTDTRVRFYNGTYNTWCPWNNIDGYILYGGCFFWNFDRNENVTKFYGAAAESMQFCWDLMDVSAPTDFCRGKHKQTENIVDNVSIGFFDGNATLFSARVIDMLQDSFHDSLPGYNSSFDAYDLDTLGYYSGPPYVNIPRKALQLYLDVSDKDHLTDVRLYGSIDEGQTWSWVTMQRVVAFDPADPDLGGEYCGTLYPTDFGLGRWAKGTQIWYYVRAQDWLANLEYFPGRANPSHPDHDGTVESYFEFQIMPMFPITYTGVKIMLVDGYGRNNYDYAECMAASDNVKPLEDIYEETLRDAGYCYDKFDIRGAGSNVHIHPIQYTDYDCVIWFCGPYFSNYLFDKEAQEAIRDYLNVGGKVLLAGDRIAYNMADPAIGGVGEDSLGGEFLDGIMGCTYQDEMEGAFAKPYLYLKAANVVTVFGAPIVVNPTLLDTILVYRECPYLKDMSYVLTNSSPPAGYTAQPLLYVLNPDPTYDPADGAIYVERPAEGGQCVFVNYDYCAIVNHFRTECDGVTVPPGLPTYLPGYYYGRVALTRTILEDLFGLPSVGTGQGGTSGTPKKAVYRWALSQNSPNPCAVSTQIRFEVARASKVSIKVYNAMGQLVNTLTDKRMDPGRHEVVWDGTNSSGQRVSSGVYFYKMEADRFQATKKMLVLR